MKKRRIFRNLNDKEFAWVLYDVGNSAYTMLACALIPIWFKAMAIGTKPGQLTSDRATAYYSMAIAVEEESFFTSSFGTMTLRTPSSYFALTSSGLTLPLTIARRSAAIWPSPSGCGAVIWKASELTP